MDYGMESGVSQIQPEVELEEDDNTRSVIGDVLYQSNPIIAYAKNQTGVRKDNSDGEADPEFDWQGERVRGMLKGLAPEQIANLDGDINNFETLRAVLERQKEYNTAAAHTDDALGNWNIPAQMAGGMIGDPSLIVGGVLWKGAQGVNALRKLNNIQKTTLGATIGATEALAFESMYQNTMGTDDKEAKMFSAAFGSVIGGLVGRYTLNLDPDFKDGTTAMERVAFGLSDGVANADKVQATTSKKGRIKGNNGTTIITPGGRSFASLNERVREFANNMVNPSKALRDENGGLVTTGKSAQDHKEVLEKEWTVTQHNNNVEYDTAKKSGSFKGTRVEFDEEVHKVYITAKGNAERELHNSIPNNLDDIVDLGEDFKLPDGMTMRDAQVRKYLQDSELNITYTHANPHIVKSAEHLKTYYNRQAKHFKDSKMKGMEHLKEDGHLPRSFSATRLEADKDGFIDKLTDSMSNHADNVGLTREKLKQKAEGVYEKVLNAHYFRTMETGSKHTKSTNRRTISYFDDDLVDYLNKDLNEIGTKYSRENSGRIAVQRALNFESQEDFQKYLESFDRKLTDTEKQDMQVIFDSITGTREVPNSTGVWNTGMRLTAKSSRVVFSPGFAMAGVAELATPIATAGLINTVNAILPSFRGAMDMLKGRDIRDPLVKEMMQLNLVGDIVSARQLQRYDSDDTMHTPLKGWSGMFERGLDTVNHGIHKYGGLGYITEVGQIASVVSGMNWAVKLAKKGKATGADLKALHRIGISPEDLQKLKGQLGHIKFKHGNISEINAHKWDKDVLDTFTSAIQRHGNATILKPDGTNIPVWMSDPNSPLAKLTMQFTRYPMAAHEKLAMKGLDEMSISQIIAIATSSALFSAVAQVKDIGREKPLFDTETEEGKKRLLMYVVSQNYMFGTPSLFAEKGLSLLGISMTGDRAPGVLNTAMGASGSSMQGLQRTAQSIINPDKEFGVARSIDPIKHFWGFNLATGIYNEAIEE